MFRRLQVLSILMLLRLLRLLRWIRLESVFSSLRNEVMGTQSLFTLFSWRPPLAGQVKFGALSRGLFWVFCADQLGLQSGDSLQVWDVYCAYYSLDGLRLVVCGGA